MAAKKVHRSFTLDPEISKKIDKAAKEDGRTASSFVNHLLKKILK